MKVGHAAAAFSTLALIAAASRAERLPFRHHEQQGSQLCWAAAAETAWSVTGGGESQCVMVSRVTGRTCCSASGGVIAAIQACDVPTPWRGDYLPAALRAARLERAHSHWGWVVPSIDEVVREIDEKGSPVVGWWRYRGSCAAAGHVVVAVGTAEVGAAPDPARWILVSDPQPRGASGPYWASASFFRCGPVGQGHCVDYFDVGKAPAGRVGRAGARSSAAGALAAPCAERAGWEFAVPARQVRGGAAGGAQCVPGARGEPDRGAVALQVRRAMAVNTVAEGLGVAPGAIEDDGEWDCGGFSGRVGIAFDATGEASAELFACGPAKRPGALRVLAAARETAGVTEVLWFGRTAMVGSLTLAFRDLDLLGGPPVPRDPAREPILRLHPESGRATIELPGIEIPLPPAPPAG